MTKSKKSSPKTENAVINTDKPWQFKPGQSGNPAGKPKGTRHKATQAMLTMLEGESEALTRKAVELALAGDTTALKLCLDRIAPPLKPMSPPINLEIPMPDSLTDTAKAFVTAAASGDVSPEVAAQMVSAIASVARVEEMEQIKDRLEALEKAMKWRKS